ncbi:MAG: SUMF1/EgtB/PvdO family nonheme iron enzyme [Planctomycetes bacterium]|nr:SUMF1/EgtB/PvdO family nonheme iron enzyme [Planctomycetota bacterium]
MIELFVSLAVASAGLPAQSPVIHELGWELRARITVASPAGAHFSAVDGSIFLSSRNGGAILRIDHRLLATQVCTSDRAACVVVGANGDLYFSEDYGGKIFRVPYGQSVRQTWVSGFGGGDRDPFGMAIVPWDYAGPVVLPGEALVADRGVNGPKEIWRWRPSTPEGESRVFANSPNLVNDPIDVAIGRDAIYFVDWAGGSAPGRVRKLTGVDNAPLVDTQAPLPAVGGVVVDPRDGRLLLRANDHVLRLDPATGAWSKVVSWTASNNPLAPCGIDISPDGTRMVVTDLGANTVFVFDRGPRYALFALGCSGSLGRSTLRAAQPPRLGGSLQGDIDNLPLSAALLFTGFSRTSSALGTLPVALSPYGMPGCQLHVSLDVPTLLVGTQGRADFTMAIPWAPSLVGVQFFQQALVYDPLAGNSLKAVMSDAAEGVIAVAMLPKDGTVPEDMLPIPAGSFVMGSTRGERNELPVHQVHITRPFWMARNEVTQAQYLGVMRANPAFFVGLDRPVERVSWTEAVAYCRTLTVAEATAKRLPAGYVYRLPTEAEWEYCCRAGTSTDWNAGTSLGCGQANIYDNGYCVPPGQSRSVGSYPANAWGLRDMHGNVAEWCLDSWDLSANYPVGSVVDPHVTRGSVRIRRGGSYGDVSKDCRSAFRSWLNPDDRGAFQGFRVVLGPDLAQ